MVMDVSPEFKLYISGVRLLVLKWCDGLCWYRLDPPDILRLRDRENTGVERGEGVCEFDAEFCPDGEADVIRPFKTGLLSNARVFTAELIVARWNDLIGVELAPILPHVAINWCALEANWLRLETTLFDVEIVELSSPLLLLLVLALLLLRLMARNCCELGSGDCWRCCSCCADGCGCKDMGCSEATCVDTLFEDILIMYELFLNVSFVRTVGLPEKFYLWLLLKDSTNANRFDLQSFVKYLALL